MSMKFFTGLQDFLGLYDPTVAPSTTTNSTTSHIASLFGTAANNRQTQQQQHRKRSPSALNKEELGDERISRCSHSRSVHFPENEDQLVSGYHEAPTNSFHLKQCHETGLITQSYSNACKLAKVTPNPSVEHQIACFHQIVGVRQECLSLKGQRLSQAHMECLEEIFRRVQFDTLDFEYTFIDDDAAVSLAEMLEFYDSTVKLNLSFNKQINIRGWQALFRAIKNCQSLQLLNLRYTSLSDRAIPVLARTLRTQPTLTTLHLENVSLSGKNLLLLVCALKTNTVLRELYLGENNLQPADGAHLYQMIVGNSSIQMLDLRNNQLQDGGLRHICDALRNKETLEKSALSALVLWNNRLTSSSMDALANALLENSKLETLNIGSNNLSVEGIMALKPALLANSSLQRLGLQATNLDCQCAIVLAECLADNKIMVRVDLRDNAQVGSAGLLALHLAMKMNTSITLLNLDNSCAKSSSVKVKEYHEQFKLYFDEIKSFCERNKQLALQKLSVQSSTSEVTSDSESSDSGQTDGQDDKQQEAAAETKDEGDGTKVEGDDACEVKQVVPVLTRRKNFDSPSHRKRPVWKFTRSSSLTCTELVEDINERILQMSRSCSTLDSAVEEPPSFPLPQKAPVAVTVPWQPKGLAEVGKSPSLPSLPSLASATDSTATIKKLNRRFSVSLSSHSASNPDLRRPISPRFKVMPVTVSSSQTLTKSISSPMASNETVIEKRVASSSLSNSIPSKQLEMSAKSDANSNTNATSTPQFVDVSSKTVDDNEGCVALSKVEKKDDSIDPDLFVESAISKDSSSNPYPPSVDPDSSSTSPSLPTSTASVYSVNNTETEKNRLDEICSSEGPETGRKLTDRYPQDVEMGHTVEETTESCIKSAQFVETVCEGGPCSGTLIEGHCAAGCSIGAMPSFCVQSSGNRCTSSSSAENSKNTTCPNEVDADKGIVANVANSSNSCYEGLSKATLLTTADVETISAPECSRLDSAEILVKDTTEKSSLNIGSSVSSREPLLEPERPIVTPHVKASTAKNESSRRDRLGGCDSDDFVFVVNSREVAPEKLPVGCNIEVVPQEGRSQFSSSANDENLIPGETEQVICTDRVVFAETYPEKYTMERSDGVGRDGFAVTKTPEIDSCEKIVICDDRRTSDTKANANVTQNFLDDDGLLKIASEDKKLEVVSDNPYEVCQAQRLVLVTRMINANNRRGEPEVFADVENGEDTQEVLCRYPCMARPVRDTLCLNAGASDEEIVRKVVKDLVNFTAFEMGDEDGLQYSGLKSPPPSRLVSPMKPRVDGLSPPRNPSVEASECRDGESDEEVIHSIMRALVRDVLLKEKQVLSRSLRKKRERLNRELPSRKLP